MEKFLFTDKEASEHAHLIEKADLSDDLAEILEEFQHPEISVEMALADCGVILGRLARAVQDLADADWPLRRPGPS